MKKYITQLGVITFLILLFLGASSISALAQHAHPKKDPYKKPVLWSQIEQSPHQKALWVEYMGKSWEDLSYTERLKVKMWIQDIWLNQLSNKNALIAVIEVKTQKEEIVETLVEEVKTQKEEQKEGVVETLVEEVKIQKEEQKEEIVETLVEEVKIQKEEIKEVELVENTNIETSKEQSTLTLTTEKLTRKSLAFEVAEKNPVYQKVLEKPKVRVFIRDLTEVVLAEPMDMLELKEDLFGNFLIIEDYYNQSFKEYEIKYVYYAQKYPLGGFSEARWVSRHDQQLKALKAKRLNTLKRKFLDKQLTASTN